MRESYFRGGKIIYLNVSFLEPKNKMDVVLKQIKLKHYLIFLENFQILKHPIGKDLLTRFEAKVLYPIPETLKTIWRTFF